MPNGDIQTPEGKTLPAEHKGRNTLAGRQLAAIESSGVEVIEYVPTVHPKQLRDAALNALTHDFGDGRVIQCRPQDEPNFERAYRLFALTGAPAIDWVMADDVKHPVTEAELRQAHDAGTMSGALIWDEYEP